MALTLGTSPSAFTPVSSGPAVTVANSGEIPMIPMQNVMSTLPQAGYKSLADLSLEYAMYLLLNQSIADRQAFLSVNLPKAPLFHSYSLPASIQLPVKPTPIPPKNFLTVFPERAPSSPSSRNSSNDDLSYLQNSISKNKLGRSYNPGRPLGMADRQKILDLYEKGHKISHIARIIGVTHSCVSKIMTRYRRTGSMYPRSAQQSKKSCSSAASVSSTGSSCSSSSNSTASLSPMHPSNFSVNFEMDQNSNNLMNLLPKTNDQLAISSALFFPKPIPLTLQQC